MIKVGMANKDVTLRILTMRGPYTTACRVKFFLAVLSKCQSGPKVHARSGSCWSWHI